MIGFCLRFEVVGINTAIPAHPYTLWNGAVILSALLLGLTSTAFFQEPKEGSIFTPLVVAVMKEANPREMLNVPPRRSLLLPKQPIMSRLLLPIELPSPPSIPVPMFFLLLSTMGCHQ